MRVALNFASVGARRGGAEKYVSTLARSLAAAGHEVHIVAEHVDRSELPGDVRVHEVRPRKLPGLRWLHPYRFAAASARELERHKFDLVIGSAHVWRKDVCIPIHGCRRALLDNAPERFRSRSARALWRLGKLANPKQWVYRWIERRQFAQAGGPLMIVPSRRVAEEFRRWHDLESDMMAVVHLGVEFDRVAVDLGTRESFRRWCGLRPDDVAVLFAARNYAIKGLAPLLESFVGVARACPTARLLVCGSNRDASYRRQAARLGLHGRVQFLGFVKDLQECLAGADVVALPTFYDTCSLVVFEALGAGVPVVTTRANGAAELVSDGINGYLIDLPWSTNQLANRLQRLILDARLRQQMGQQARIRAPGLAIESSVRKTLATIGRLHRRRAA